MSPVAYASWPAPEGRLVEVEGRSMWVTELGSGPALLFLHGGGPGCHGWSDFGPVAETFGASHRCVLVDLLQYGRSDKPAIDEPVWSYHARHLVGLLDQLHIERTDLVCSSWGGSASLCMAATYPARVGAVVVTGVMPVRHGAMAPLAEGLAGTGPGRGKTARDDYYGGTGPSLEKMRQLMARYEWYDAALIPEATVAARYQRSIDPGEWGVYRDAVPRGAPQDLSPDLRSIAAPVLFVWGMHDYFLPPDYALMLANMVPEGHLHVMADVGHHLEEEQPEAYSAVVGAFLHQRSPLWRTAGPSTGSQVPEDQISQDQISKEETSEELS